MNDKFMLRNAAHASGIGPVLCYDSGRNCLRIGSRKSYRLWRPLQDDGDLFRLAAYMQYRIEYVTIDLPEDGYGVTKSRVDMDATRRRVVAAAADYGYFMKFGVKP
ncbi:hypothetical protein V2K79_12320 [Pseudomonas alliivorans]|nr:hypothetical protein [Pseudomonas alliivorans]MEE4752840.1 hypothetical protein [Pseudomonas alliivorans]